MRKRIFPFLETDSITWCNYSNYLRWINIGVQSLKNYLEYFNPNFQILNASLPSISSNTWTESKINPTNNLENKLGQIKKEFTYNGETVNVIFPHALLYREGYINQDLNTYLCYDYNLLNLLKEEEDVKEAIQRGQLVTFPPSTAIFSKKWTHNGYQTPENWDLQTPSAFIVLSQAPASLYLPQSSQNALSFNYVEDGQRILGTNILFSFELFPTRYFFSKTVFENGQDLSKWNSNAIEWSISGAYWESFEAPIVNRIQNFANQVWSNSYPLMYELVCRYKDKDKDTGKEIDIEEEFICDSDFKTEIINIANHSTILYTVSVKNIDAQETNSWNDFISVRII